MITSTVSAATCVPTPFNDDKYNFIDKLKIYNGERHHYNENLSNLDTEIHSVSLSVIKISSEIPTTNLNCKQSLRNETNAVFLDQVPLSISCSQSLSVIKISKEIPIPQYESWSRGKRIEDSLTGSAVSSVDISENSSSQSNSISPSYYSDESIPSDETIYESSEEMSIDNTKLPTMELIAPYKHLSLAPSCFVNGCICGHDFEFRDMAYEPRKRRYPKSSGVTIRPKINPISAKLRYTSYMIQ